MRIVSRHPWKVTYDEALAIQARLRTEVSIEPLAHPVRLVAGADVAYSRATHRHYAAVVVLAAPEWRLVETARAVSKARFPYIPGLFSFRELPPLLRAFDRLRSAPDVAMFDGQGLAHPRRFGLACHAGVLLGIPAVGCAKSRLTGTHGPVGPNRGNWAPLTDGYEVVGAALRTRAGVQPVFVSPGHLVDLESAIALVLDTSGRYRLPEPARLAHRETSVMQHTLDRHGRSPVGRTYPDFVRAPNRRASASGRRGFTSPGGSREGPG